MLDAVQRNNLTGNTLIIFTSDNGPFPEGGTGGLRGGKGTAWDGGYRVPFIARWPGHIPAGAIADAMAMNIDLLPSIAAITGAPLPPAVELDGRNFLPVLLGDTDDSPHEVLYISSTTNSIVALRTQDWKMVVQASYRDIQRRLPEHDVLLLFDMRTDPQERYSLAGRQPDKWEELHISGMGGRSLKFHTLIKVLLSSFVFTAILRLYIQLLKQVKDAGQNTEMGYTARDLVSPEPPE